MTGEVRRASGSPAGSGAEPRRASFPVLNRRGFILPLLLVVVSVILLLALQRLFFARHTLLFTARLANHEVAYQAALGALKCGRAQVAALVDALNEGRPADALPKGLEGFALKLRGPDGALHIREAEFTLDSPNLRALERASGARIECLALIDKVSPIPGTPSGPEGPAEVVFRLAVRAVATYEGSRVALAYLTEGRRVLTHLPLLPKFTLHVKRQGDFRMNGLVDSEDPEKVRRLPLVLTNGRALGPNETLKPQELADLLDAQGFVYLGGDIEWKLGLSTCGRDPKAEDAGLRRSLYLYDLEPGLFPGSERFSYYARPSGLFRESALPEAQEIMKLGSVEEHTLSSLVNLHGAAGAPSPTFVAGDCRRHYLLMQGFLRQDAGMRAELPYLPDEATFASRRWPGGTSAQTTALIHDVIFRGDYARYRDRMTQPVREHYNRALHAYLRRESLPPELMDALVLPDGQLPPLSRLKVNDQKVRPDMLYRAAGRVELLTAKGEPVYAGDFDGPDLAAFLAPRVCYIHKTAKDFFASRNAGGRIAIQGVEKVLGPLEIDGSFALAPESFGLLVADGDIRVSAPIPATGGHLYLVSLNGNIAVETTAPVHAYLAAPKGTVELADGAQITGGVACDHLSSKTIPDGRRPRRLAWDARFDVTDDEVQRRGCKVVVRRTWDFVVE